jgi:hypothetical protein
MASHRLLVESNSRLTSHLKLWKSTDYSRSRSHIATDGLSVSKSWCRAPDCLTVTVFLLWGALSDERTGLSFVHAAGPCQRSLSRVRVP